MDATLEKRPLLNNQDEDGEGAGDIPSLTTRSRGTSRSLTTRSRGTSRKQSGPSLHIDAEAGGKLSPKKLGVVLCILATELCERLAYYSVVANLVLFCTSVLGFTSNNATTISLIFSGTTYLMPIIGGYIADAHIGMYNAIYGFALIYLIGLFLIPCSAVNYESLLGDEKYELGETGRRAFYLLGLVFVCVGTGGIKANVAPFGALQVQDLGPKAVQSFFNWWVT
ncbi:hypothetical protein ACOMHN_015837 [Nucella lapillus]